MIVWDPELDFLEMFTSTITGFPENAEVLTRKAPVEINANRLY